MKRIIFALAFSLLSLTVLPVITDNIVQAQEKPVWIDVRTQGEFDTDHLTNAVLIPYNEISKKIVEIAPDKRQRINLYCRTGRRAEIALHTLESMGYVSVQNLGGIKQLRAQGIN